jgi:YD repeat-containing protein
VTSRTDARNQSDSTETYEYDTASNLIRFTDRRGKVTRYGYDALNRRTCAAFAVTAGTTCATATYESKLSYTWDKGSRLTQVTDSLVATPITRVFDDLNRLTSETTAQGTVTYTHHTNGGRRATMSVPNQSQVSYSYDGMERLSQISQGTASVGFGYDSLNRRANLTLPNGITMTYGYDTAGQLTGLTYSLSGSNIGQLTYAYDPVGQQVTLSGSYARTGLPTATTSTPTYDTENRLTGWNGATLTYDANGNLTSDGTNSYQWNGRNRLVTINNGTTATFTYDGLGRRTSKALGGTTTSFLYDGLNPVQEQVGGSASANLLTGGLDEYFTRTDSSGARLVNTAGEVIAKMAQADDGSIALEFLGRDGQQRAHLGLESSGHPFLRLIPENGPETILAMDHRTNVASIMLANRAIGGGVL